MSSPSKFMPHVMKLRLILISALTASVITATKQWAPQPASNRHSRSINLIDAGCRDIWFPSRKSIHCDFGRRRPGRWCRRSRSAFAISNGGYDIQAFARHQAGSGGKLDARTPSASGVRSWKEEFAQKKYHNPKLPLKVDDGKLRKHKQGKLGRVDSRDMERVLARGNGKSPGLPPHFGRMVAEAVAAANEIKAGSVLDAGPLTVNIVLHEWLENRLTHYLAERADRRREVTVFVGNEFFVDGELLRRTRHILVTTGGTRKASSPQTVACMATVALARALSSAARPPRGSDISISSTQCHHDVDKDSHDELSAHEKNGGLVFNMIADGVAVEGVMAACLSEVRTLAGASVALWRLREDWESSLAAPAVWTEYEEGGRVTLVEEIEGVLVSAVDVPKPPRENREAFLFAAKRYRDELRRGGQPLLMDAEGAGTQSERRNPPFYSYHKLKAGVLLVAVASDSGVLHGLRARSGGVGAAEPSEYLVLEAPLGPANSADSILAVFATEALLLWLSSPPTARRPMESNKKSIDDGSSSSSNGSLSDASYHDSDDNSSDHESDGEGRGWGTAVTVLLGRDAVLQDLVEIAEFNGVEMATSPDLPHNRVRPRPRGRGIPRANRLKGNKRGTARVPLGRRS